MGAWGKAVEVVVTAADHPTGLGTARAVTGADVRVTGLCHEAAAWPCRSGVWDRLVPVSGGADATLDALLNLPRLTAGPRVLLPADDETMHVISRHRDELRRHDYAFVLPPPPVVDLLLDKTEFHAWAGERGFPVPETHVASSEAELRAILRDIRYPAVLKPLRHTPGWEALSPNHKAYKLFSRSDVDVLGFSVFDAAPKFVVQRWIEGGDDRVHFCLTYVNQGGEEAGAYTGRKYLQWPPQTGSTAICVGEPNEALLDLTRAVWKASGFCGLGSLEAKYSVEDGQYYITEPTVGRNNLQSYVATAGGVNMTRLALKDALGAPVRKASRPRAAVWINEPFALLAVRQALVQKKSERRSLLRLFTALRSVAFAYFSWRDPGPFVAFARASLQRLRATAPAATPAVQPASVLSLANREPRLPGSTGAALPG